MASTTGRKGSACHVYGALEDGTINKVTEICKARGFIESGALGTGV